MGVGSSKVEWSSPPPNVIPRSHGRKQPRQEDLVVPQQALPVVRNPHKHGVDDPYYPPAPPQPPRSQSSRAHTVPSGVKERREKRMHRAFVSEGGGHFDPSHLDTGKVAAPPPHQPLRNPLPPPPKDLFAQPSDFSRVHYASPPPFVPVPNDQLKRSRITSIGANIKGKGKETASSSGGREVLLQRAEPSSSFSSHSSVSTSNPPPQVITTSPIGVLYNSQALHDPHAMPPNDRSTRSKTSRFLSTLKSPFSPSRPPERQESSVVIPRISTTQQHHSRHASSPDGRSISPPYMLAPRAPPPPQVPPVFFYWPGSPYYGFTTFSPHRILYKKRLYPTAEHLYQSMKFLPSKGKGGDIDLAERIRTCSDHPGDAVLEGRLLNKKARPDWKEMRAVWMDEIMYMKFSQHPDLRYELVSTAPADLIFASPADAFWGIGPENRGRNELGQVLVRVRARILREMGK